MVETTKPVKPLSDQQKTILATGRLQDISKMKKADLAAYLCWQIRRDTGSLSQTSHYYPVSRMDRIIAEVESELGEVRREWAKPKAAPPPSERQ